MGLELHGALDDLLIKGVLYVVANGDDDGLVHLVADDNAHPGLSQVSRFAHSFVLPSY